MNNAIQPITYHALLVGVDRYPPGYNSLAGCVNDIDAIEKLLLDPPGIGIPPEQIQVTRLAAPMPNHLSTSRFVDENVWPTKANLISALQELAGPKVKANDRVLIYYSGHGDEIRWSGSNVWHEALVPHDNEEIEYLSDVEVNMLIGAIAAKAENLTVILDCCHSAGATRDLTDISPHGNLRFLLKKETVVEPPDLTNLGLPPNAETRTLSTGMLQMSSPEYLVVVACQSDEKAGEGAHPADTMSHGVFTHSLLTLLENKDAEARTQLRWADLWPTLIATAAERNVQLGQRTQHPWIIGRSERKVFGGPWQKMDAGYRITKDADDRCIINAGTLMGVTEGAEIAIYDATEPRFFPPLGSSADRPIGRLTVTEAERATAIAEPMDTTFSLFFLPDGARGRLVKPGMSERLRVSMKPEGTPAPALLAESSLLEIVPATAPDADTEVIAQPNGRWIIGGDIEPVMAVMPANEERALRAGLEQYYRYSSILRFAKNCNDPQVSKCLDVRLLDCNNTAKLQALSAEQMADPDLPEAPRDDEGSYRLPTEFQFCFRVTNNSSHRLYVTLFNASAGGLVEYLSDAVLREHASHVMWLDGSLGAVFAAYPDSLPADVPGIPRLDFATDRVIAIGTTRPDVDLRYLTVDKRVQEVVDENLSTIRGGEKGMRPTAANAPAELWTAAVVPVRLAR